MGKIRPVPMVPGKSRVQIEALADRAVHAFFPIHAVTRQPVPVHEFFEFILPDTFHVDSGASDDLSSGVEGIALPNGSRGRPEILLAEEVFDGMHAFDGRSRFTAAHECAHGVMHMRFLKTQLVDGAGLALYRRQEIKPYLDPEWQAGVFAGAFLMPTQAVLAAVDRLGEDPRRIAMAFAVSIQAADYRIDSMRRGGLLT